MLAGIVMGLALSSIIFVASHPVYTPIFTSAFAQEIGPRTTLNSTDLPRLNTTDSTIPVLEEISDKGIFRVLLKWPEVPLNPTGRIDIQIVFLDALAPEPSPESIPQRETNFTGQSRLTPDAFVVPEILEHRVPVESYDLVIYSPDGEELWRENGRAATGGTGDEHIILPDYYGPVTISVENIVPGWDVAAERYDVEIASDEEQVTDSVSFQASVVPEFSFVVVVSLAVAMSLAIVMMRLRNRNLSI